MGTMTNANLTPFQAAYYRRMAERAAEAEAEAEAAETALAAAHAAERSARQAFHNAARERQGAEAQDALYQQYCQRHTAYLAAFRDAECAALQAQRARARAEGR